MELHILRYYYSVLKILILISILSNAKGSPISKTAPNHVKPCESIRNPFEINPDTEGLKKRTNDTSPDAFEDIIEDPNNSLAKAQKDSYDIGAYSTVCWIEITTITEFKDGSEPKIVKEYAISFDSPSQIPEEYIEDVKQSNFYKNTKKSFTIPLETVKTTDKTTVKQTKNITCGSGPLYTKEEHIWTSRNKKKLEFKVSPKNLSDKNCGSKIIDYILSDISNKTIPNYTTTPSSIPEDSTELLNEIKNKIRAHVKSQSSTENNNSDYVTDSNLTEELNESSIEINSKSKRRNKKKIIKRRKKKRGKLDKNVDITTQINDLNTNSSEIIEENQLENIPKTRTTFKDFDEESDLDNNLQPEMTTIKNEIERNTEYIKTELPDKLQLVTTLKNILDKKSENKYETSEEYLEKISDEPSTDIPLKIENNSDNTYISTTSNVPTSSEIDDSDDESYTSYSIEKRNKRKKKLRNKNKFRKSNATTTVDDLVDNNNSTYDDIYEQASYENDYEESSEKNNTKNRISKKRKIKKKKNRPQRITTGLNPYENDLSSTKNDLNSAKPDLSSANKVVISTPNVIAQSTVTDSYEYSEEYLEELLYDVPTDNIKDKKRSSVKRKNKTPSQSQEDNTTVDSINSSKEFAEDINKELTTLTDNYGTSSPLKKKHKRKKIIKRRRRPKNKNYESTGKYETVEQNTNVYLDKSENPVMQSDLHTSVETEEIEYEDISPKNRSRKIKLPTKDLNSSSEISNNLTTLSNLAKTTTENWPQSKSKKKRKKIIKRRRRPKNKQNNSNNDESISEYETIEQDTNESLEKNSENPEIESKTQSSEYDISDNIQKKKRTKTKRRKKLRKNDPTTENLEDFITQPNFNIPPESDSETSNNSKSRRKIIKRRKRPKTDLNKSHINESTVKYDTIEQNSNESLESTSKIPDFFYGDTIEDYSKNTHKKKRRKIKRRRKPSRKSDSNTEDDSNFELTTKPNYLKNTDGGKQESALLSTRLLDESSQTPDFFNSESTTPKMSFLEEEDFSSNTNSSENISRNKPKKWKRVHIRRKKPKNGITSLPEVVSEEVVSDFSILKSPKYKKNRIGHQIPTSTISPIERTTFETDFTTGLVKITTTELNKFIKNIPSKIAEIEDDEEIITVKNSKEINSNKFDKMKLTTNQNIVTTTEPNVFYDEKPNKNKLTQMDMLKDIIETYNNSTEQPIGTKCSPIRNCSNIDVILAKNVDKNGKETCYNLNGRSKKVTTCPKNTSDLPFLKNMLDDNKETEIYFKMDQLEKLLDLICSKTLEAKKLRKKKKKIRRRRPRNKNKKGKGNKGSRRALRKNLLDVQKLLRRLDN